jgi:hypothetical protein
LDRENVLPDELPVLTFRDLTPAELKAFQERDETDEESELGVPIAPVAGADLDSTGRDSDESEEIVVEGEEQEDGKVSLGILGLSRWETSAGTTALTLRGDFVSVGVIALYRSKSHSFSNRPDPSALCSRGFFQGAIGGQAQCIRWSKADLTLSNDDVRFAPDTVEKLGCCGG